MKPRNEHPRAEKVSRDERMKMVRTFLFDRIPSKSGSKKKKRGENMWRELWNLKRRRNVSRLMPINLTRKRWKADEKQLRYRLQHLPRFFYKGYIRDGMPQPLSKEIHGDRRGCSRNANRSTKL